MTSRSPRVEEAEERLTPMPIDYASFEKLSIEYAIPHSFIEVLERSSTVLVRIPQGYHARDSGSHGNSIVIRDMQSSKTQHRIHPPQYSKFESKLLCFSDFVAWSGFSHGLRPWAGP